MAEMNYASRGLAGSALGIAIGGLATGLANGGLGNLLGGWGANNAYCHENMPVNRYEQALQSQIANLETEVKLRDANFYTLGEMGKLREYVDGKFARVEKEICDQKVYNTANTATINCIANQVNQLMGLTKIVIPNANVCPGWGDVTVSITPTTTPTT